VLSDLPVHFFHSCRCYCYCCCFHCTVLFTPPLLARVAAHCTVIPFRRYTRSANPTQPFTELFRIVGLASLEPLARRPSSRSTIYFSCRRPAATAFVGPIFYRDTNPEPEHLTLTSIHVTLSFSASGPGSSRTTSGDNFNYCARNIVDVLSLQCAAARKLRMCTR
jgi:hypothetical protein